MMIEAQKNSKSLNTIFLKAVVVITIASQIEFFEYIVRPLMYVTWALLAISTLIVNRKQTILSKFTIYYLFAYMGYVAYCGICVICGTDYFSGQYIRALFIPLMMSIFGDYYGTNMEWTEMVSVIKTYVITAFFVAIWVNCVYFQSYQTWLSSTMYAYTQKNSTAQIWCSAVIFVFYIIRPIKGRQLLWYGIVLYLVLVTALSQCRTALLAMASIFVYSAIIKSNKGWLWIIILITCAFVAFLVPSIRQFFDQVFMISIYKGTDLNTFSSGRIQLYIIALSEFAKYPLTGVGTYYVDCSYISILAESGIIGFIIIQSIWILRITRNIQIELGYKNHALYKNGFVVGITIFYFVESLLEGLPPFGPGVSSFMFWIICEVIFVKKFQKNISCNTQSVMKALV